MIGKTKKLIGIISLILALLIIGIDYLYMDEFKIEGKYLITIVSLFVLDIYRRVQLSNKPIAIIVSLGVFAICIYQFSILCLLGWGYGFTGANIPFIWVLSIIVNSVVIIISLGEIYRNAKDNGR